MKFPTHNPGCLVALHNIMHVVVVLLLLWTCELLRREVTVRSAQRRPNASASEMCGSSNLEPASVRVFWFKIRIRNRIHNHSSMDGLIRIPQPCPHAHCQWCSRVHIVRVQVRVRVQWVRVQVQVRVQRVRVRVRVRSPVSPSPSPSLSPIKTSTP